MRQVLSKAKSKTPKQIIDNLGFESLQEKFCPMIESYLKNGARNKKQS